MLSVALRTVMRFAEHLTILDVGCAALAPRRHMVCVHILQIPNLAFRDIVANGTQRAV